MGQAEYRAMLDALIDANAEALANALWVAAPEPEPPVDPEPEPEPPDPIPPQPAGKPGPGNTGPSDPSLLVPSGSITIRDDNAVVENVDVTGLVRIQANNVTLRNFRINAGGTASYGVQTYSDYTGALVEDGEITNSASAGVLSRNAILRRLNIHEQGGDAIKPVHDTTIEACWLHHLGMKAGSHADCFQMRWGENIVIRGNYCDIPRPVTAPYKSNACVLADNDLKGLTSLLIEGNWFNGGGWVVYFNDKGTGYALEGIRLLNNRFTRNFGIGPLVDKSVGAVITGNVWDDTGELMDINNG